MIIQKTATDKSQNKHCLLYYKSARNAFKNILLRLKERETFTLLLPAYIGYSKKEGSGIYDPVIETEVQHQFYKLDRYLNIDINFLEEKLSAIPGRAVVLLVHYFGYPDDNIQEIVKLCKKYNAFIIEDAAHALYTDFIDHICGSYGSYTLYSIHKMLPYEYGGMLKVNIDEGLDLHPDFETDPFNIFDYDFVTISQQRKNNAKEWKALLTGNSEIEMLRENTQIATPQTFPVIVKKYDRNNLYFKLNEAGFGDVSLYHTMIRPVAEGDYKDANWVSQHITNLPVHQDIKNGQIHQMYKKIISIINE